VTQTTSCDRHVSLPCKADSPSIGEGGTFPFTEAFRNGISRAPPARASARVSQCKIADFFGYGPGWIGQIGWWLASILSS
jgi:hypothetical protein